MKLHKSSRTLIAGIATMSLILVGSFLSLAILSDVLTPAEAQAAVYTAVGSSGENISVGGAGDVQLNITPTAGSSFIMGKQTLTIGTDLAGYQAYISMTGEDQNLYLGGDTTKSALGPIGGSYAEPIATDLAANVWGYAIPARASDPSYNSTLAPNNGFGTNDNNQYSEGAQEKGTSKWAGVPKKSNITMIQSMPDKPSAGGQSLDVWYAATANTSRMAGVYSGEVQYTVLSTAATSITPASISRIGGTMPVEGNIGGDNEFEITLGISPASSILDSLKVNSRIYIGNDSSGWISCGTQGGANDYPSSATLNPSGQLVFTCYDRAQEISGRYDVKIVVSDGSNSYGTYYIGGGVEYVTSGGGGGIFPQTTPVITNAYPSVLTSASATPMTFLTNVPSSVDIITASSVSFGNLGNCTNPTVTTISDYYAIKCTSPSSGFAENTDYTISANISNINGSSVVEGTVKYKTSPNLFDIKTMQDMSATVCNNTTKPGTTATAKKTFDTDGSHAGDTNYTPSVTLTDIRDTQQYTVRKLADGNCWMTENLRFGVLPDNTARPWDSSNDPDLTTTTNSSYMNMLTNARISDASGCGSNFTSSNYSDPEICTFDANTTADYDGKTKYGVLYNYCAATGGTVCNSSSMSADATGSVCPKGWKLPGMTASATGSGATTDGSVKSYNNLANSYGYNNNSSGLTGMVADATVGPINLVRAGYAYSGSLSNRSASGSGHYWVSTKYTSNGYANKLYLSNSSGYYVQRSSSIRYAGLSVRCVSASS